MMPILDLLVFASSDPPSVPYFAGSPALAQRRLRTQAGEIVDVRIDADWTSPIAGYGLVPLLGRKWRIIRLLDALPGDENLVRGQDALYPEDVGKGFFPRRHLYRIQLNTLPQAVKDQLIPRKYPDIDHLFFLNHSGIRAALLNKYPQLAQVPPLQRRPTPWDIAVTRAQLLAVLKRKVNEPRDLSGFPEDDQETDQQIDEGDEIR